jgi:hypothetical protein
MLKRSPFQSKQSKKMEFEAIGSDEIGVIYLLKRGGISPSENPQDMQEMIQRQAEATLIFLQGVRQLAERDGITTEQARERLFPTKEPPKTMNDGESSAIVLKEPEIVVDEVDLYDVLDPAQAKNLILNQENAREVAIRSATLFIQNRLLYPIVLTQDAKVKNTELSIEPLRFGVAIGNKFKIEEVTIEVTEEADFDSESIAVSSLPQGFDAGTVGFLLDATGRPKTGDDQWTEEMTRKHLMEDQISLIYAFYQSEIGVKTDASDDDETEGNLTSKTKSLNSSSTSTESRSTGEKSTGESRAMGFGTSGSTPKTLETSPIGS